MAASFGDGRVVVTAPILAAGGEVPDHAALQAAATVLRAGQVLGMPTDTVYGVAVDPRVPGSVDRIFAAKGRPRSVELPVLVADRDQAVELCGAIPPDAQRLMDRFWPGALTIVLPLRQPLELGGDGATVGVRCPAHPVPRALCAMVGPLATTSANPHGEPPAEEALAVSGLPGVALVLDAGTCAGLPSTVVDCSAAAIAVLRHGRVPWAVIQETLRLDS